MRMSLSNWTMGLFWGRILIEFPRNLVEAKDPKRPSDQSHSAPIQYNTIQSNAKPLNGNFKSKKPLCTDRYSLLWLQNSLVYISKNSLDKKKDLHQICS